MISGRFCKRKARIYVSVKKLQLGERLTQMDAEGLHLVLFMFNDLSVGGLFGQQLSSSALQDGLHGAEARAHPGGEVEVLPLEHTHLAVRTGTEEVP